jgi:hypothetical protein
MVRLIYVTIIFLLICCSNKQISYLKNNKTMVPSDSLFFKKNYRDIKYVVLPNKIDTSSIYIESYYLFGPKKIKYKRTDLYDGIFKFYKNGAFNDFSMSINNNMNLSKFFNPDYRGSRGMCFKENDKYYIDIIGKSSELNTIGVYRYEFVYISKDTIKFIRPNIMESSIYVYTRKPITNDTILNFKANW